MRGRLIIPPNRPLKICSYPTCNRKVKKGYCEEHKGHDKTFAGKRETHPFYNSTLWRGNPNESLSTRKGLRARHIRKQPYCVECYKETGVIEDISHNCVVDHVKRWQSGITESEKRALFSDPDNLQTLCHRHHNMKSGSEYM